MKFTNDYLKELLGTSVCKVDVKVRYNDQWQYLWEPPPEPVRGYITVDLTFETNSVLKQTQYGSLRVVSFREETGAGPCCTLYEYELVCTRGKETDEVLRHLLGVEE